MPVRAEIYYFLFEGSDKGQRPPVVLIHGAGGTHLYWPANIRRLTGYRVYALDLPGHGKSGGSCQQSISGYTEAVLDWLGAVGVHSAVFVGHSMGGAIAMSLALDHTEHVMGLGLVGTGARLRVAPALLESVDNTATFHSAIDTITELSFSKHASRQLTSLAAQRMAETRPSVLHADFLACNAFDEMERVEQIRCRTLVVCGAEDMMTPLRYSQFLSDRIPNAVLKTIQGAGHMVMLEQPKAVMAALSDFLATVSY